MKRETREEGYGRYAVAAIEEFEARVRLHLTGHETMVLQRLIIDALGAERRRATPKATRKGGNTNGR